MGTEHKPCPYCGASGHDLRVDVAATPGEETLFAYVFCKKCAARGPRVRIPPERMPVEDFATLLDGVEDQALELWDRRAGEGA